MSAKGGFCMPNTTQTPDGLFAAMPDMKEAELRVTLHLVRQTFGWRREWSDPKHSTMPAIAGATGLSPEGVRRGLRAGLQRGTIERAEAKETRSFSYRIRVNQLEGQPARPSTKLRVKKVEGQAARGSRVKKVEGQGSTKLGDANNKELTPTLTPTEHPPKDGELPATDMAANDAPRLRNERFDAFCKAWAVDPDKPGNKAGLAQAFDTRCEAEGATVDEFREFYLASKRAAEWGKFVKPHSTTDEFLAWRRVKGYAVDPMTVAEDSLQGGKKWLIN